MTNSSQFLSIANKRVLIVEDMYLVADDIRGALSSEGAEIIAVVSNVDDAMHLAHAQAIDIATLDIDLHGETIFHVADVLQKRKIPFLFVTGFAKSTVPSRFTARILIHKPFSTEILRDAVEKTLCSGQ